MIVSDLVGHDYGGGPSVVHEVALGEEVVAQRLTREDWTQSLVLSESAEVRLAPVDDALADADSGQSPSDLDDAAE
ncbi:hypothetical protein, partial [Streptomyces thermogriseus]|uniref:hypothetical protein n=1 Tax=Streptomyces thermogriseus TaxID=75292 RepID=UPI0031F99BC1